MKNWLFILLTTLTAACIGMEKQQTPDTNLLGQASLNNLPTDLKVLIIKKLASRLPSWRAGTAIRNLGKTNKQFYQLINSEKTTEAIVKSFMEPISYQRFNGNYTDQTGYLIEGLRFLCTKGTFLYLKNHTNTVTIKYYLSYSLFDSFLYNDLGDSLSSDSKMIISFLIKCGVDINTYGLGGRNYPIIFFIYQKPKKLKFLLELGANINIIINGKTIMDEAFIDYPENSTLHKSLRELGAKTAAELNQQGQS